MKIPYLLISAQRITHFSLMIWLLMFACLMFLSKQGRAQNDESLAEINNRMETFDYVSALQLIDDKLFTDSLNSTFLVLKSRALSGIYRFNQAVECMEKAWSSDTGNLRILAELITICQRSGENEKALYYAKKAVNMAPNNRHFRYQLAEMFFSEGFYNNCLLILKPVVLLDSNESYPLNTAGNCYYQIEENDSAYLCFNRMLQNGDRAVYCVVKMSNILIRRKDYSGGLTLTMKYLDMDSTATPLIRLAGYFHYMLEEYDEAEEYLITAIRLNDTSKFVFKYAGLSFYREEVFDTAEYFLRKAYFADTNDAEMCFYYGVAAARSVLYETGFRYLQKTLDMLMPSEYFLSQIYIEQAEVLNQTGETDSALYLLLKARGVITENGSIIFRIAYQYDFYLKDEDNALAYYLQFVSLSGIPAQEVESGGAKMSFLTYARNRISEIQARQ